MMNQTNSFNQRNGSLGGGQTRAQRKAVALYKAPVVKERYKRVGSHFNKQKNSSN